MKAFADDNIDVTQTWKFDLGTVMNIAGEGEIAGYQHFFVFSQCFQKHSFSGSAKEPRGFNPLPNDEIWALTKLKDLADDKFTVAKMLISLFDRVENIVRKEENAGYQHSLLFPQCFQKASLVRSLKVGIVW